MRATTRLDAYEQEAVEEIRRWVAGERGPVGEMLAGIDRVTGRVGQGIDRAYERAVRDERVRRALGRATDGTVRALATFMARAVPRQDPSMAYGLRTSDEIAHLPLQIVDRQLKVVRTKHQRIIIGIGAAEGAAGLAAAPLAFAGLVAGVPALQAASLRAVAELSASAGFDPDEFRERQLVAEIALRASSLGGEGHAPTVHQLVQLANATTKGAGLGQVQQTAVVGTLSELAARAAMQLARRRFATLLPVVGALAGAGFNAAHADRLLGGATMLFRARHLARRHGMTLAEIIDPA